MVFDNRMASKGTGLLTRFAEQTLWSSRWTD
jgi:hypothetical protein